MSHSIFRRRVHPAVAAVAVAGAAAGILTASFLVGRSSEPAEQSKTSALAHGVLPPGSYPTEPLARGTAAPKVEAAGWLNGSPEAARPAPKLVLLDIWSGW